MRAKILTGSGFRVSNRLVRTRFWWKVALVAALPFASCAPRPIAVGVILPLTGDYAAYGLPMKQGMVLATETVNAAGGIGGRRLELRIEDSRGEPSRAAQAAQSLIEKSRVPVLLAGGTSAEVLAAAPVAQRYGRVLLSPSASTPLLTGAGDWIFRNYPSDALEGKVMADFAAYTLHASKVLIVASENPYSEGLRGEFAKAFETGGRTTETLLFRPERAADAAAEAARRFGEVHAIYLVGYAGQLVPLVKALRAAGVPRPLLATSAVASAAFGGPLGKDAEGVVFPRPQFDPASTQPAVAAFVSAYRAKYGDEPDIYAAHAYDAVLLVSRAMTDLGPRPDTIRQGLLELRNFPGVSGPTTFDAEGDVLQPYQICIVREGRSVPIQTVLDTALPALQKQVEAARFGGK